jgi:acyl carrier protein
VNRQLLDMANHSSHILRNQLPLPQPYVAPRNVLEEALAEIWCAALNTDCVGVEDEFIDLGGDSFAAVVILAMIEEKFGVPVPLSTLVEAPTVAALAREIAQMDLR